MKTTDLIVMLTYNDHTLENAGEIFEACKDSKAQYWGFKEQPLPVEEMKKIFARMKECGKTTLLEVVAYTEPECIEGAKKAVACGVDVLMGTVFFDSVLQICKENNLKYMPFVGEVVERPSILKGSIEGMIEEAKDYINKGADGIDLLGYRYVGDPVDLNKRFVEALDAPVCIAGSIDSDKRLDEVKDASPETFTIGSAFFDHKFGEDLTEQINYVCDYMNK